MNLTKLEDKKYRNATSNQLWTVSIPMDVFLAILTHIPIKEQIFILQMIGTNQYKQFPVSSIQNMTELLLPIPLNPRLNTFELVINTYSSSSCHHKITDLMIFLNNNQVFEGDVIDVKWKENQKQTENAGRAVERTLSIRVEYHQYMWSFDQDIGSNQMDQIKDELINYFDGTAASGELQLVSDESFYTQPALQNIDETLLYSKVFLIGKYVLFCNHHEYHNVHIFYGDTNITTFYIDHDWHYFGFGSGIKGRSFDDSLYFGYRNFAVILRSDHKEIFCLNVMNGQTQTAYVNRQCLMVDACGHIMVIDKDQVQSMEEIDDTHQLEDRHMNLLQFVNKRTLIGTSSRNEIMVFVMNDQCDVIQSAIHSVIESIRDIIIVNGEYFMLQLDDSLKVFKLQINKTQITTECIQSFSLQPMTKIVMNRQGNMVMMAYYREDGNYKGSVIVNMYRVNDKTGTLILDKHTETKCVSQTILHWECHVIGLQFIHSQICLVSNSSGDFWIFNVSDDENWAKHWKINLGEGDEWESDSVVFRNETIIGTGDIWNFGDGGFCFSVYTLTE
eukprot:148172_1